ncbi:MAG: hypothetical protein KGI98_09615 [Euryarchaeota archaeon]|nr:hypothetical protein [Euryarchaeota archaeon]
MNWRKASRSSDWTSALLNSWSHLAGRFASSVVQVGPVRPFSIFQAGEDPTEGMNR